MKKKCFIKLLRNALGVWDAFYTKKKSILEDLTLRLGKFFPRKVCTNLINMELFNSPCKIR